MTEPGPNRRDRLVGASGAEWQQSLADPDPGVRRAAVLAGARRAGREDRERFLRTALDDTHATVRREAAEAAGRHPKRAATLVGRLSAMLLGDDDAQCREAAAFALGESGDPATATTIMSALDAEATPLVREAAVAALGALGRPDTLGVVIGMTTKEKPAVRRRAVVALAGFDDPAADAAIAASCGDRDRYVREAAEWLMREDP